MHNLQHIRRIVMLLFLQCVSKLEIASGNRDEGNWLQCKPRPGCVLTKCDPTPDGWTSNEFDDVDFHLERNEFPMLCKNQEATFGGTRLEILNAKVQESTESIRKENLEQKKSLDRLHAAIENVTSEFVILKNENYEMKKAIEALQPNKSSSKIITGCEEAVGDFATKWDGKGGIFNILSSGLQDKTLVYCDITTDGGKWTVFQRRTYGSVNFVRNWRDYAEGFGSLDGEFWLGLEKIHRLTSGDEYEMRIDLMDWEGRKVHAHYSTFSVGSSATKYQLRVGGYSGTAGDSLTGSSRKNLIHNNMKFSSFDSVNDKWTSGNCADSFKGGWWYNDCFDSNLNGIYYSGGKYSSNNADGIVWHQWKDTDRYSMKSVEMKMRPKV